MYECGEIPFLRKTFILIPGFFLIYKMNITDASRSRSYEAYAKVRSMITIKDSRPSPPVLYCCGLTPSILTNKSYTLD